MHKIYFSWEEFDKAMAYLSRELEKLAFDGIYAIPRGGLIPAVVLSHKLGKPLLEFTDFPSRGTLVVDDISDTGKTLNRLALFAKYTATIHYVTSSIYEPTIWAVEKPANTWIVYPWE